MSGQQQYAESSSNIYKCSRCDFTSVRRAAVERHQRKYNAKFNCKICEYSTDSQLQFRYHLLDDHHLTDGAELFKCRHCSYDTFQKNSLKRHVWFVHYQQSFSYQECSFKTTKESDIPQHQVETHKYECSKCGAKFGRCLEVKRHIRKVHNDKTKFRCNLCEYTSNLKTMFKSHLLKKHQVTDGAEPLNCPHCSYNTFTKHCLDRHVSLMHDEQSLTCQKCQFKAEEKSSLFRHEVEEHGESPFNTYRCSMCSFRACKQAAVKHHELTVHEIKMKFHCELCDYTSNIKNMIRSHLLKKHQVTDGAEPLNCPHCPYNTFTKHCLHRHILLMHDEQSLTCQRCSFKAEEKSGLFRHEVEAHGESPFNTHKCSKCSFRACKPAAVKHHELTVHEIKTKYHCELCDYTSNIKNMIRSHLLKKHQVTDGAEPLKCPHCSYNTFWKHNLERHVSFMHNEHSLSRQNSCTVKHEIKEHDDSEIKEPDVHKNEIKFRCKLCEYTSNFSVTLKSHLLKKHQVTDGGEPFKCPHCLYNTFRKDSLRRHIMTVHKDQSPPFKVKTEPSSFEHETDSQGESSSTTFKFDKQQNKTIFRCALCEYTSSTKIAFRSHLHKEHQLTGVAKPLKCAHCPYSTFWKESLKRHISWKHVKFNCRKCSFKAEKKAILFWHEIEEHGESSLTTYECSKCDFKSCWREAVKRHESRVHKS